MLCQSWCASNLFGKEQGLTVAILRVVSSAEIAITILAIVIFTIVISSIAMQAMFTVAVDGLGSLPKHIRHYFYLQEMKMMIRS